MVAASKVAVALDARGRDCTSSEYLLYIGRRGCLVVECQTPEREDGGSILTQVAVLYP